MEINFNNTDFTSIITVNQSKSRNLFLSFKIYKDIICLRKKQKSEINNISKRKCKIFNFMQLLLNLS